MPADCPHCAKSIDSLPGFISQEKHVERLNAKAAENTALAAELQTAREKASAFDATSADLAKVRTELEGVRTREARTGAMAAAGLSPELLDHVALLFDSAKAGDETLEFAAWLGEEGPARAHPLLAPHFGAGQQAAGQQAAGTQANTGAVRTAATAGSTPAGPKKGPSPADLQAIFSSPEFAALPRDQQRARMAELQTQVASASSAAT
jgi:hypothetical protein